MFGFAQLWFVGRGGDGNKAHFVPCFCISGGFGEKVCHCTFMNEDPALKYFPPEGIQSVWNKRYPSWEQPGANRAAFDECFTLKSRQSGSGTQRTSAAAVLKLLFQRWKLLFQHRCQNRKALAGQATRSSTIRRLAGGYTH